MAELIASPVIAALIWVGYRLLCIVLGLSILAGITIGFIVAMLCIREKRSLSASYVQLTAITTTFGVSPTETLKNVFKKRQVSDEIDVN